MSTRPVAAWPRGVWLFIVCELAAMAAGVGLLVAGRTLAALGVLFVPVQLALLLWLSTKSTLLLGFFVLLLPLAGFGMLPGIYRDGVMFGTLVLAGLWTVIRPIAGGRQTAPLDRSVTIALALCSLSVLVSLGYAFGRGWGSLTTIRYSSGFVVSLFAVWLFAVVPRSVGEVRALVRLAGLALVVCCLLLPSWALAAQGFEGSKTVIAPFGTVTLNLLGFFIAPTALALLGMSVDQQGLPARGVQLLGAAVLFAALVYTRSRGAWFGFGAGILFLIMIRRSLGVALLSAVAAMVFLLLDPLRESIAVRAQQTGVGDPAILGRLVLWATAFRIAVANYLVGIGAGAFNRLKFAFGFPGLIDPFRRFNTHSFYLEILVGLGFLGFASYFALPIVALRRLLSSLVTGWAKGLSGLALGLSSAVVCVLVHGLVESPAWHAPTMTFFGVLLGLSFATASIQSSGWFGASVRVAE